MRSYILFALIAAVLIAIVVDLAGRWRAARSRRRGRKRTVGRAGPARENPKGDFPQTTFASDDRTPVKGLRTGPTERDSAERSPVPEAGMARNVFKPPPTASATRMHADAASIPNIHDLVHAVPDAVVSEPVSGSARTSEFDAEKTNVYLRPTDGPAGATERRREGMAVGHFNSVRLVNLSGHDKGKTVPVPQGGIVIGRHPACNVVVSDPRVSGHHAWVGVVDEKVVLRDLKSTNGTLLNAHPTRLTADTELRSGDTIFLGGHAGIQFRILID
jgi:hypothetical protein